MPPMGDLEYAAIGFETFHETVLATLAVCASQPLCVSAFQTTERLALDDAAQQEFRKVNIGFRWGPVWSSCWFKLKGELPPAPPAPHENARAVLHFSCGSEALLWRDGKPFHGLDPYHRIVELESFSAQSMLIEAACNRPLGATMFWWEHAEEHERWAENNPGRLDCAQLEWRDRDIEKFNHAFLFATQLLKATDTKTARAHTLERGLRSLRAQLLGADATTRIPALQSELDALLAEGEASFSTCVPIGHAHIDTAWLWPIAETRRKCLRSFATQLRNLERHPEFRFLCSQPQQYAFVEEDSPALFEEIRARVAEGRWEPAGAMWIEPDANAPSGESLVRQITHGVNYFREKFGDAAPQRFLYLPDTFGFPASLPQLCRLAGLETFITNKIAWSESNTFPHVTFEWRGIDGTSVLTHLTPGHNYNSSIQPADFIAADQRLVELDGARAPIWLQPYGWGDGGGGPDDEQIANARCAAIAAGLPKIDQMSATSFCDGLHATCDAEAPTPIWDGELYLELHRGTYTTHARLKQSNRRAERDLRVMEILDAARGDKLNDKEQTQRAAWLDRAWKTVLLNQFHDILPGSSIASVYELAHEQLDQVHADCERELFDGLAEVAMNAQTENKTHPAVVFNSASTTRSAVLATDAGLRFVRKCPPLGVRVIDLAEMVEPTHAVKAEGLTLDNGRLRCTIDNSGRVSALALEGNDIALAEPLNTLVLYADKPRRWEAWDIDRDYVDHEAVQSSPARRIELIEHSSLRAVIEVERELGAASSITQRYVLDAESAVLRIESRVDWQESQTLLRTRFSPKIRARNATFGIQFGAIERATHTNTSWDKAMFEVPGHLWMDLSQPGLGLSILDDGSRLGRSVRGNTMALSLLRQTKFPDPTADRGIHNFAYGICPHAGCWRAAAIPAEAEAFGCAMRVATAPAGARGEVTDGWQALAALNTDETSAIEVSALKRADDGNGIIARLCERHGGQETLRLRMPDGFTQVTAVDLLESPRPEEAIASNDGAITMRFEPFQLRTVRFS